MPLLTRRRLLACLGLGGLAALAARVSLPRLARIPPPRPLEGEAAAFVEERLAGLDRTRVWDVHAHMIGVQGASGTFVNPDWKSHLRPYKRLQYEIHLAATGIADEARADRDFFERLLALQRGANPSGRLLLLALDYRVGTDGAEIPERTEIFTPNELVLELARAHPEIEACVSVHPYRVDALQRLEAAAAAGARAVKWLPPAMGIDPASPLCDAFYERLVALRLPLITHAGGEESMDVYGDEELGNPLLLRRALDAGVRVIAAHCAGLGECRDLDRGPDGPRVPCFDLFLRLLEDERYTRNLFGDVSAMVFVNRAGRPLREVLVRKHLHPRLLYGSDYPLVAIDHLVSTRWLEHQGFLRGEERRLCQAVFEANPLLFDLVLKRCIGVDEGGVVQRFGDSVFETDRAFV